MLVPMRFSNELERLPMSLKLPSEVAFVHSVFHDFMLKKCIGDPLPIVAIECLGVDENLPYEEVPL